MIGLLNESNLSDNMNDWEELSVRRLARFSMSVREGVQVALPRPNSAHDNRAPGDQSK